MFNIRNVFSILTIVFAFLKEKAAILISGFNSFSKDQRDKYDKKKLSADMRNSLIIWSAILLLGSVLSFYINKYCAVVAIVIWLIIFFKDVHIDPEKAFRKYKKL